jgi:hypothetical protein
MNDVLTSNPRGTFKEQIAKELEQVSAYMEELEQKERLDCLLKIMPFVMPKVSSVEHDEGEPASWGM